MSHQFLRNDGQFFQVASADVVISTSTTTGFLAYVTNFTTADVTINTTSLTDGPSVAQGSSGVWYAVGTITIDSTAIQSVMEFELWDGTTTIASCASNISGISAFNSVTLSGILASPAGNIKISGRAATSGNSVVMRANSSGLGKDCTLTALRIG